MFVRRIYRDQVGRISDEQRKMGQFMMITVTAAMKIFLFLNLSLDMNIRCWKSIKLMKI